MPIYYQQNINDFTQLAVWKIEESESFFTQLVTVQQQVTHPHKRLQHLAGRFLLPYLYPNFPSDLIQIADTRKPYLPNEAYHFSISHCGDYAAAIVSSTQRVGVDVELVTHRVNKIRHKFLHPSELSNWDIEAMEEIGNDDYFFGEGVCLIEWAELIEELIPEGAISITIEKDLEKGFDYRKITVE